MKYDDHDFEMFGDLILLVIVMFLFVVFVAGIGGLVWWLIR
jgi:flagellar basal body-associated protein FliL